MKGNSMSLGLGCAAALCCTLLAAAPTMAQEDAAQAAARHPDCGKFKRDDTWHTSKTQITKNGEELVPPQMRLAAPIYPVGQLMNGVSGTVVVRFTVDAAGEPVDLSIQQTPGKAFSDHATISVLCSQFRPATLNGMPVPQRVELPFKFGIRN
jgi:TonB family protein